MAFIRANWSLVRPGSSEAGRKLFFHLRRTQQQLLSPGEPSALILGALLTVVATSVVGGIARRRQTSAA